ncbi:hypothetical protein [Rhizobium sp. CIAT894]|uniref:hypothetical protein n=1 Tax=Rhizobium sp. CIAT894 TaxID=2020312 RepID=UPI000F7471CC|nr:hypothetical protein [Rhizobium sp. CIAT894]
MKTAAASSFGGLPGSEKIAFGLASNVVSAKAGTRQVEPNAVICEAAASCCLPRPQLPAPARFSRAGSS